jgi:hypothetical protein
MDLTVKYSVRMMLSAMDERTAAVAWRSANKQLAAEAALWKSEPRRIAKFTADTVSEVVSFTVDEDLLAVLDTDRRTTVRDTVRTRRWDLERLAKREAGLLDTSSVPNRYGPLGPSDTLAALTHETLDELANALRHSNRFHEPTVRAYLESLGDDELRTLLSKESMKNHDTLLSVMLVRGLRHEVFAAGSHITALASAFAQITELDADMLQRADGAGMHVFSLQGRSRFSADGIEWLQRNRKYAALLANHLMTLTDVCKHAGVFSMDELDSIITSAITSHQLRELEPYVLATCSAAQTASHTVVAAYDRVPAADQALVRELLLASAPRTIVNAMLEMPEHEVLEVLDELQRRGHMGEMQRILSELSNIEFSDRAVFIADTLLQRVESPLGVRHRASGWVWQHIMSKVAAELEENDWALFFKLMEDFSGSLDELLGTIRALRN